MKVSEVEITGICEMYFTTKKEDSVTKFSMTKETIQI